MSDDCVFVLRGCHEHLSQQHFEGLRLLTVHLLSTLMANVKFGTAACEPPRWRLVGLLVVNNQNQ